MSFLPRRIMTSICILATLIIVACETGEIVNPVPADPEWVSVTPQVDVLRAIGATLQLQVVDALGHPFAVNGLNWSVLDAGIVAVDASGRVTALSPGTARVVVAQGTLADTASIQVRQDVASLTVSPTTTTIFVGATQQIVPTLRDANGHPIVGRQISWTSSATTTAAVSVTGLVRGIASGVTTITATCDGRTATAAVTVSAMPTGGLFTDNFESGSLNDAGRWHDMVGSGYSMATAAAEGITAVSGTRILRLAPGGASLSHFVATGSTSPYERLFLSFWMYRSSAYEASNPGLRAGGIRGSTTQWGSYGVGWGTTGSCADDPNNRHRQEFMFAYVFEAQDWTLRTYTNWLGAAKLTANPPTCGGGYAIGAGNSPEATYHDINFVPTANAWHKYEIEVQLNAVGQSNGWQRIWVDGVLKVEHLNVTYRTTSGMKLWAVTFDTGTVQASPLYLDDVYVAASRPP